MSAWDQELEFALYLSTVADEVGLRYFRRDPQLRRKADGTIVTEADEAIERLLREEIAAAFPGDAIIGEEGGASGDAGRRRWILDPLDGTMNYAWGLPIWGTLIALEVDGEIAVGIASAPALGERYDAARGSGARLNGEPIHVSDVASLADARVSHASFASYAKHGRGDEIVELLGRVQASRGITDFWGHALVAAGHLDVMVEAVVNEWDVAPLVVLLEEAGGRFTDLDGERRADGGSALSTNGKLHDAVLEVFAR